MPQRNGGRWGGLKAPQAPPRAKLPSERRSSPLAGARVVLLAAPLRRHAAQARGQDQARQQQHGRSHFCCVRSCACGCSPWGRSLEQAKPCKRVHMLLCCARDPVGRGGRGGGCRHAADVLESRSLLFFCLTGAERSGPLCTATAQAGSAAGCEHASRSCLPRAALLGSSSGACCCSSTRTRRA